MSALTPATRLPQGLHRLSSPLAAAIWAGRPVAIAGRTDGENIATLPDVATTGLHDAVVAPSWRDDGDGGYAVNFSDGEYLKKAANFPNVPNYTLFARFKMERVEGSPNRMAMQIRRPPYDTGNIVINIICRQNFAGNNFITFLQASADGTTAVSNGATVGIPAGQPITVSWSTNRRTSTGFNNRRQYRVNGTEIINESGVNSALTGDVSLFTGARFDGTLSNGPLMLAAAFVFAGPLHINEIQWVESILNAIPVPDFPPPVQANDGWPVLYPGIETDIFQLAPLGG